MKPPYYPPQYQGSKFHCIYCGVYASQEWKALLIAIPNIQKTDLSASLCNHCGKWAFWYKNKMIIPSEAPVEPAHHDLPDNCKPEYDEARDIFARSPRASAALLRLCIQKLLPTLGANGKNINDDISALVAKGLPVLVQRALDVCRVIGNNAVHPGEINLKDTPEIAQQLFQMINFIVEDRITRPKEVNALYEKLPESTRIAIAKRDQQEKATP